MKLKFLLYVCCLLVSMTTNAQASGFMPVANILKSHGAVLINKQKSKVGDEIAEGMTISIPKSNDYVDIKFQNGHVLRLIGASLKVDELNPKNASLNLNKGKILGSVKSMTTDEKFSIKSKRISLSLSATKFIIEENKMQTYLGVVEGRANVQAKSQSLEVNTGEELKAANTKAALSVTSASRSKIDSAMALIQSLENN